MQGESREAGVCPAEVGGLPGTGEGAEGASAKGRKSAVSYVKSWCYTVTLGFQDNLIVSFMPGAELFVRLITERRVKCNHQISAMKLLTVLSVMCFIRDTFTDLILFNDFSLPLLSQWQCFVSYLRSVYLMKNKDVFDVFQLKLPEYAMWVDALKYHQNYKSILNDVWYHHLNK